MIYILKNIGSGLIGIGERQITQENLFRIDSDKTIDTNYFINEGLFTDGILKLLRSDSQTINIPLDGRYLQNFTEQDPTVPSHVKAISINNISNWNNGFYDDIISMQLTKVGVNLTIRLNKRNGDFFTQTIEVGKDITNITQIPTRSYTDLQNLPLLNITDWNTAFAWGDHSTFGYITGIANITDIPLRSYTDLQNLPIIDDEVSVVDTNTNPVKHEISVVAGKSVLETVTKLNVPTLVGNVLTLKLLNENNVEQVVSIDLSGIVTNDSGINNATYDAASNVITLTETDGDIWTIDLSEFSIISNTDPEGVTTLTQEGVIKLTASKVGQTGNFPDLLQLPTSISGYGITDAFVKSEINNFFGGITPITGYNKTNWDTAFAWGDHSIQGYITGIANITDIPLRSYNDLQNLPTLNIANWNTAYAWDNHATQGYLTSFTEQDPTVAAYTKTLTTASKLLTEIKTVDGAGSGLDADLLDNQHGDYYNHRLHGLGTTSTINGIGRLQVDGVTPITSFNQFYQGGFHTADVGTNYTDGPYSGAGSSRGAILNFNSHTSSVTQFFSKRESNELWYRDGYGGWKPWVRILDTGMLGTVALSSFNNDINYDGNYVLKTGDTMTGSLTSTSFIKSGGTASQFLKADGSVDNTTYLTSTTGNSAYVKKVGDTMTGPLVISSNSSTSLRLHNTISTVGTPLIDVGFENLNLTGEKRQAIIRVGTYSGVSGSLSGYFRFYTRRETSGTWDTVDFDERGISANGFIKSGGTANEFLKADGSVDSNTYLTSYTETDTLDSVTSRDSITTNSIGVYSVNLQYGATFNNGTTKFLIYNNPGDNLLYVRDTTNGAMLTTLAVDKFTSHKKFFGLLGADITGEIAADILRKKGGLNTQFLKADGTVDSNTYSLTSHTHTFLAEKSDIEGTTLPNNPSIPYGLSYMYSVSVGSDGAWGHALTLKSGVDRVLQISGQDNVDELSFRRGNITDGSNWGEWKNIWHSGNLTNVSQLNNDSGYLTSTTGDSAYVKKVGDTMTGTLNGKILVASTTTDNTTPVVDTTKVDGFGIIGNRGNYYITNAGGAIIFGNGTGHANNNSLTISSGAVISNRNITAPSFIKSGGTSTQFLKADGSVDTNNYSISTHEHTFTSLLSKPTTISGYGITDAYTKGESDGNYVNVTGDTMSGDLSFSNNANVTYANINASGNGTVVRGGFLNPAAEANMVHLPHIINDLAGFDKWGTITVSGLYKTRSGTAGSYTYTNPVTNSDAWDAAFDGNSSTVGSWYSDNGINGTTQGEGSILLEWPNEAAFSLWAGIVFGSGSFTASRVKIEAFRGGIWQTLCDLTGSTEQVVLRNISGNSGSGSGTTKLRYTLGSPNSGSLTYFRVHTLYMANYRAGSNTSLSGLSGGNITPGIQFLERYKDNFLHGALYPGTNDTYDLGSSLFKWKNAHFSGILTASSYVKSGGLATEFLKADGSVDSNTYALSSTLTNHNHDDDYVNVTGDTMTGKLSINTTGSAKSSLDVISYDTHLTGDLDGSTKTLSLYNNTQTNNVGDGATLLFETNYDGGPGIYARTTRAGIKGGTAIVGNTASGYLKFYTDNAGGNSMPERMIIDHNGNVGIGTTNPNRLLDVNGIQGWESSGSEKAYLNPTSTGSDFALKNSLGNTTIRLDSRDNADSYINGGGNVGINTTNPTEKLDVAGNAKVDGNLHINSSNLSGLTTNTIVATASTTKYDAAHFDYILKREDATGMRTGTVMVVWDGTNAQMTDMATMDLGGTTSPIDFAVDILSGEVRLTATIISGTWTVKVGTRTL